MDYDFINNYTESYSVSGNDYTIIDSLNLDTGSFNTKKITYNSYVNALNSIINSNINSNIDVIQTNISDLTSSISNKFDKRGLTYSANERITGPLTINSKLSVNNFSDFDSNINLKFNKIINLSVISPTDAYDGVNKQYVDDLLANYETPDISKLILKSGDTMTGFLTLISATPSEDLTAITKKYVDDTSSNYNIYVHISGDTLTGDLSVLSPSQNSSASTKKYVDDKLLQINYALRTGANITDALFVIPLLSNSLNFISNKKYVDDKTSTLGNFVLTTGSTMTSTFNVYSPLNLNITDPNLAVSKFYVDNKINALFLKKSGGSLTGSLSVLEPIRNLHAVTKNYIDNLVDSSNEYALKTGANITGPLFINALASNSLNFIANKKYVDDRYSSSYNLVSTTGSTMTSTFNVYSPLNLNITDPNLAVSKFYVDDKFNFTGKYLLKSGGSLTGSLSVLEPTQNLHIVTKNYIDNFNYNLYLPLSGGIVQDLQLYAYEPNYSNINHNTASNITVNINNGNCYYVNLNQNCTGFIINNINPSQVYYITLFVRQKTTTSDIAWNINGINVRWEDQNTGPSISKSIDNIDVFTLIHMGGQWFGINGGQQFV